LPPSSTPNYGAHLEKNHIIRTQHQITHSHNPNSLIFPLQLPLSRNHHSGDIGLLLPASLPDKIGGKEANLVLTMNLSIQIQWIDQLGFYFDTDFPHYIAHSSTHHSSAFSLPLSAYLPDKEAGTHVNLL